MTTLTKKVLEYQVDPAQNALPVAEATRVLEQYVSGWSPTVHEIGVEALNEFYGRMPFLMRSYREKGASFDAYLATSFRLHLRGYIRRTQKRYLRDELARTGAFGNFDRGDVPSLPATEQSNLSTIVYRAVRPREVRQNRHLLILVIKNICQFEREELTSIAASLNVPDVWLRSIRTAADDLLARREKRRLRLLELRDHNYLHMLSWQQAYQRAQDEEYKSVCRRRAELYKARLTSVRRRLCRIPLTLTHTQVGMLLGLPKGSVDSAIAAVRRRLENGQFPQYPAHHERFARKQQ